MSVRADAWEGRERRWKTVRGSKREELRALFAANRRLFKAYVLREELDHLWTYKLNDMRNGPYKPVSLTGAAR